jgi:hypothetical protein
MAGTGQQDGKIYVGSTACVASALVTTANQLAEIDGTVTLDTTWEKAEIRWRTRAVKDIIHYAIDAQLTLQDVEFKASCVAKVFAAVSTGSMPLYGEASATALFWKISTSTAPADKQWVFEFTRTADNKRFQLYAPRGYIQNWPTPFVKENFTLQSLTVDLIASTSGEMIKYLEAV